MTLEQKLEALQEKVTYLVVATEYLSLALEITKSDPSKDWNTVFREADNIRKHDPAKALVMLLDVQATLKHVLNESDNVVPFRTKEKAQ